MKTDIGILAGLALVTFIGVFTAMFALGVISPLGVRGADQSIDDNGQAVDFQLQMVPQAVTGFMVDNTVKHPGAVSGFRFSFVTAADLVAHQDTITVHFDKEFEGHGPNLSRDHVTVYASVASGSATTEPDGPSRTGAYNPSYDATLDRLEIAHPVHHANAVPSALSNSAVLNNIEYTIPVPDMNGANDGAPGIAAGSTVTVYISPAAGIRNPTEAGRKGPLGVYTSEQPYLVYGRMPIVADFSVDNTVKRPGVVSGFRFSFVTAEDLVVNQDTITVHFDKDFKGHGASLSRNHVTVSARNAGGNAITPSPGVDSPGVEQTGAYNPSTDATLDLLRTAHPVHHANAVLAGTLLEDGTLTGLTAGVEGEYVTETRPLANLAVLNNVEYTFYVPDMNGIEDGAPGIAAGSMVTVVVSPAAGITNTTEGGVAGPGGDKCPLGAYTSEQPYLVYSCVDVVLGIALSDYDANRGKALTVIGRGFPERYHGHHLPG